MHAAMRHGTSSLTSLPKDVMIRIRIFHAIYNIAIIFH